MAATDTQSEFSERKRCREEDNSEPLASPEQGSSNKKKRKRKKKDKEPHELPQLQVSPNPSPSPNPNPEVPQIENVETTAQNPDLTPQKKKKKKKKKKRKKHVQDAQQLQTCNSSIPIEHHVPDPSTPENGSQKKKRRRKRKNVLQPEVAEPEQKDSNNVETGTIREPKESIAEDSGVCLKPELAPPSMEKREEPIETNVEHPQVCSKPESAPPINPDKKNDVEPSETHAQQHPGNCAKPDLEPSGDLTMAIDQSRRTRKNRRQRKRKRCSEEKVENQGKPLDLSITPNHGLNHIQSDPTTPIFPKPASLTDQTIAVNSAMLIDTEQKEPIIPIGQAPLLDTATPIDQGQNMTKKKRRRKKKGVVIIVTEGEEPNECNGKPPETVGENSTSKCNAEPAATTPVRRSVRLNDKAEIESSISMRCQACRQLGHKFQHCQRLKSLSMDEEVCFFCGEIGHSLGKCSVTQAGGGRFAKCLFCYEHGHFSFNCPKSGHRIVPKVCADWSDKKNRGSVNFEISDSELGWFYPEYMGLSELFQVELQK